MKNIAVFMDRDGTINEEVGYLDDPAGFKLLPGAAEAIKKMNQSGIKSVVVSNQSGVARGYFSEDMVDKIHQRMEDLLMANGAHLDRVYFCPHHPDFGDIPYRKVCRCRKPAVGMLEKAAGELKIDLASSYVVGDRWEDIELAHRAGARGVLVLTGYGRQELKRLSAHKENNQPPPYVARDLLRATDWILEDFKRWAQSLK